MWAKEGCSLWSIAETSELDLEERKERFRSSASLPATLAGITCGSPCMPAGVGGLDKAMSGEKKIYVRIRFFFFFIRAW